jgi:hypothetical protein
MQDDSVPVQMLLTSPQLRNLNKGKPFQMSHNQLINGTGNKHVELHLSPDEHHRLMKNIQYGKGHRFKMDEIRGGSFLGSLGKVAKSVTKVIPKSVAQTAVDLALNTTPLGGTPIGNALGQTAVNSAYGSGFNVGNFLKKNIPKNVVKDVINTGLSKVGANNPITQSLVNTGVNSAYGGKLQKGSPEMKAKMAHLRSLRKGKGIGSIVKGVINNVKKNGIRKGVADSLVDGINSATGTKVGNVLQPLIHQGINKGLDKVNIGVGMNPCSQLTNEVKMKAYRKGGKRGGNIIVASLGGKSGYLNGNIQGGSFLGF